MRTHHVDRPDWSAPLPRLGDFAPGIGLLGIGANSAIFSILDTLVVRSLPVRAPERRVQIAIGEPRTYLTNPQWERRRDRPEFAGWLPGRRAARIDPRPF